MYSNRIDIFIGDETTLIEKKSVALIPFFFNRLTWCIQKIKPVPLSRVIFYLCTDPLVFVIFTLYNFAMTAFVYGVQVFERQPKYDLYKISVTGFAATLGFPCTMYIQSNKQR